MTNLYDILAFNDDPYLPYILVSVNSDPLSGYSAQDPRKVGLRAKVPIPGANAFFYPHFLRDDPIFPPIS